LEDDRNFRDLLFFVAWINFALRVTDLLNLKVKDLFEHGDVVEFFDLVEKKTKKKNRIYITDSVKKVLKEYIAKYPYIIINPENYLFFTKNWKSNFGRRWALEIMNKLTSKVGLRWNFWTHTLRKTWWYHARQNNVSLSIIQNKLNHSNIKTTELYLWITTEEVGKACLDLNL
jgi:site-specific recombinase XerD